MSDTPPRGAAADPDASLRDVRDDGFFADLQRALGDSYLLERELGGGGMSRVFAATEPSLGRLVVLKLLTPELAAGVSADRFTREIRLAASLQQANIVPLLAAGSASGLPYYTMPFVEGRSLRDRIAREGALPIGDAVGILRDVARALAYAHERGVVHRDIKPDNVLLSGGTAVVSDFGIAKAIGAAREVLGGISLTSVGMGIGTPAYIAPEQAAGDPSTDHRADIYAFGCLAYEVFTGAAPFAGRSAHELIAAHFGEDAPRATGRRPDVPPLVDALIVRCMEKDPARRPQSAAELLRVLDAPTAAATPGDLAAPTQRLTAPPRGSRPYMLVGALLVVVATGGALLARRRSAAEPLTFAVVPCRNVGGDTTLEYRSDGLSDEILNAMGRVAGVRVTGRTAAYRFKGRADLDAREAERTLGARLLLTCTLRQNGPEVALSTQLSDSATGGELVATTLTGDRGDIGGLTDQVVSSIVSTLRVRFGIARDDPARASSVGTTNGQALDDYLLGQALLKKRGTGVARSIPMFEHAIALDANFARAYAALANALQLIPYFDGTLPSEVHDRTINAAQRALQLDSTLADAHMALGSAYAYRGEWERANAEFQRGVSMEPGNATAHFTFGRNLLVQARVREAGEQFEAAHAVERISPLVSTWMSYVHFVQGRRDSAVAESRRAVQLDSTLLPVINLASLIDINLGHKDLAARLYAQPLPVTEMTNAPYVSARLGDTARAERALRAMDVNEPRPWFADISRATYALARGDTATALTLMERTQVNVGPIWAVFIPLQDPVFDPIRRSARFAAVLRAARMNVEILTRPQGGRID